MVVSMDIVDDAWMAPYFAVVPGILEEYGARQIAGAKDVRRIEGEGAAPQRMAIFSFPSIAAVDAFMADERYRPFRKAREIGAISDIFIFENAVNEGQFV